MLIDFPGSCLRSRLRAFAVSAPLVLLASAAHAQISFTTAIDLALKNSPKVQMAQANVDKAKAVLSQNTDAYVPNLSGGSGLGYSYGFPLGQPTLFSFSSQSLVFNYSQHDYIRAAHAGVEAASQILRDTRQEVAEDTAITYLSLDRTQRSETAMDEEYSYAQKLATIVEERLDAGREPRMELAKARRTAAQVRLQRLLLNDDETVLRDHLSRLIGLTVGLIKTIPSSVPAFPPIHAIDPSAPDNPGVLAAFSNAHAKREQAFGDSKYAFRPQVYFAANYSRFSTFNNYQQYYNHFQYDAAEIGVQITIPLYDRLRKSKARETMADAIHAEKEAVDARNTEREGRIKLANAATELQARVELADIDQDIAQQQLDATLIQLQSAPSESSAPLLTPKDEQNARIQERQRFIDLQDAGFQLKKTEINLLRQTGQLEDWLKTAVQTQSLESNPAPSLPSIHLPSVPGSSE